HQCVQQRRRQRVHARRRRGHRARPGRRRLAPRARCAVQAAARRVCAHRPHSAQPRRQDHPQVPARHGACHVARVQHRLEHSI
ncbi:hypothetical protein H4S06_005663, partial [Coemansia sp. BCRC 34490]